MDFSMLLFSMLGCIGYTETVFDAEYEVHIVVSIDLR